MLQALVEFAERKGLMEDTASTKRPVHFVIVLDANGEVVGVRPNFDERGRPRELSVPVPPLGRTVAVKSGFLVDNAQYTLGQPKAVNEKDPDKQRKSEEKAKKNADERAEAFAEAINEALADCDDDGLRAVSRFFAALAKRRAQVHALARAPSKGVAKKGAAKKGAKKGAAKKGAAAVSDDDSVEAPSASEPWPWTGDETLAFELYTDAGLLVHQRPKVALWWSERSRQSASEGAVARCVVTGEVGPTVLLHPSIKRVPEAQQSGAQLVSFNASAFCSWGMKQGENAPVSARAATAYGRALNHLLSEDVGRARRFRQGIQVSDNSVLVFWARPPEGAVEHEGFDDVLPDLLDATHVEAEASPDEFRLRVEAIWRRLEHREGDDATRFYAMTLGSNASRVVVRDWFETTATEVKQHVRWWLESLRVGEDRDALHPWRPPTIRELLRAMQSRPDADGDKGGLSAALSAKLVRCALRGDALGAEVLRAALARLRLAPSETRDERWLLDVRVGLIRACLRRPAWTERREVTVALDPANREVGYVLGRLFCVLESLQLQAQGQDLNASIRDKFFASASTTPSAVFGPLLQRAQHHIAKLDSGGADRELADVLDLLPGAALPSVLSLEQQGLFALGYYHQRSHTFRRIAEYKQQKKEREGK